jgi:hypothetical protein
MTDESTPYVVKASEVRAGHDALWNGRWVRAESVEIQDAAQDRGQLLVVVIRDAEGVRYETAAERLVCVRDPKPSQPQSLRKTLEEIATDGWFRADDLIDTFTTWLQSESVRSKVCEAIFKRRLFHAADLTAREKDELLNLAADAALKAIVEEVKR